MDEDGCYVQFYFYDKLSSLRPSDVSNPSIRHVRGTSFSCIRRDPEYGFTKLFLFLTPSRRRPRWLPGDLLPSPANLQGLWGRLFPLSDRSAPHQICYSLLRRGNSIVFNLVFSFLSFLYIASRFLWSRYSYDPYVKCLWVLGRFKRDQYCRVAS
jgi:hypothetical protein